MWRNENEQKYAGIGPLLYLGTKNTVAPLLYLGTKNTVTKSSCTIVV